ncbi:hypothetical protein I302_108280 [Kwoniella bestiolae CBS 10118]|uniref:Uncharacterized protein n=1 Tax=Kwoniella bestiolae CBS 10118 TaxID=1296100 RepID=A0A1B9FW49_9TREE|nr:hypothetical protein I302_07352 [Kwoniella bestiolae CBS 10118]OCF23002.1 hypothetical protein I302_07352 [Kwoniella bestiolae CBS 10118]
MPSILDLEDETIRLISHYTNRDAYIPLPSYGPHHQNFKSEINPKGLHVNAQQGTRIAKWMTGAPREVEQGVRRLRIGVPFLSGSDQLSIFSTLTLFLHRIDNLEELIINSDSNQSCHHLHGYTTSPHQLPGGLRIPLFPFIPKLKSLSVQVVCPTCAEQIPNILVPAAPMIQHLKMTVYGLPKPPPLGQFADSDSWDDSPDPSTIIKDMAEAWCNNNKKDTMGLKTLYLRYWPKPGEITCNRFLSTIRDVSKILPSLEELAVAEFGYRETLRSGIGIRGKCADRTWSFECDAQSTEDDEPHFSSLEDTLSSLCLSSNLKVFDPVFVIVLDSKRPTMPIATRNQIRSSYEANRPAGRQNFQGLVKSHEGNLREAISGAAQIIMDTVPSLERGHFWEKGTELSKKDWYRWTWRKVNCNGVSKVHVEEVPEYMSSDFVSCKAAPTEPPQGWMQATGGHFATFDEDEEDQSDMEEGDDNAVDLAMQMQMDMNAAGLMMFGPQLDP